MVLYELCRLCCSDGIVMTISDIYVRGAVINYKNLRSSMLRWWQYIGRNLVLLLYRQHFSVGIVVTVM